MKRVTIVNLAGRALHVEDEGVEAIDGWMESARRTLAADPDRDELLSDFEEAIADRFAVHAPGATDVVTAAQVDEVLTALGAVEPARGTLPADPDRDELLSDFEEAIADRFAVHAPGATDVVTAAQVDEVLTALGSVEPADAVSVAAGVDGGVAGGVPDGVGDGAGGAVGEGLASEGAGESVGGDAGEASGVGGVGDVGGESATSSAGGESTGGGEEVPLRQRRLYRLTGEGERMIAGVAAGIGSYLNVDVTVVRLVAVMLAIASFGITVVVYVAMALIVPAADSPHERLAAEGYGDSAREVMSRARASTSPALASVGSTLRAGAAVILAVVTWGLMLAISAVLIGGSVAVTSVFVDPTPLATAFDDGVPTWVIAVWVSCGFWLAAGVLIVLASLVRRLAAPSGNRMLAAAVGAVGLVMMTAAAIGFVSIPMAGSTQMRGLLDGEGEIEIFEETWCFTSEYGFEEKRGECDASSSRRVIGEVRVLEGGALERVGHRMLAARERVEAVERRLELRLGALGGRAGAVGGGGVGRLGL